jgi:membrane-associated phospholipid phosphatase
VDGPFLDVPLGRPDLVPRLRGHPGDDALPAGLEEGDHRRPVLHPLRRPDGPDFPPHQGGRGPAQAYFTTSLLERGLHWPLNRSSFFGFFSGHASNAFGFAVCSWLCFRLNDRTYKYKVYGWCVFLWAFLVSLSRIMMAAHFFGDVLVGTFFGLATGLLCAALAHAAIRQWVEPSASA